MAHDVCPWWLGPVLASPLRRWFQDPHALLSPWVKDGDVVLEPGPGMGFFTLELARLAGPAGRVVAVDLQPKMLEGLRKRARKAGVDARIETRVATAESLGVADLAGRVDFVLAAAMVHELPDAARFFAEVAAALRPGGRALLAEPSGHVNRAAFAAELELARRAGLRVEPGPTVRSSHAALLVREGPGTPAVGDAS